MITESTPINPAVENQFKEATDLLNKARHQLENITAVEEARSEAVTSLEHTAQGLSQAGNTIENATGVVVETLKLTQTTLDKLVELADSADIATFTVQLSQYQETIETTMASRVASLTAERDAAQQALQEIQAIHQELMGRVSMLPKRVRKRLS